MKKSNKVRNLSARSLLLMMVGGEHASYCQRQDLPANECVCLRHEVKQWQERMALSAKNRVKRPRHVKPKKVHVVGTACSKKANAVTTSNLQEVTCGHCLKSIKGKGLSGIITQTLPSVTKTLGLASTP